MRSILSTTIVVIAVLASATAALAHAQLARAFPPPDSTLTATPKEVTIQFTEALEPRFSSIEVQDAAGQKFDDGSPHLAPDNDRQFSIGLKPLVPGVYKVIWHATSVDTHKTEGSYQFTVKP